MSKAHYECKKIHYIQVGMYLLGVGVEGGGRGALQGSLVFHFLIIVDCLGSLAIKYYQIVTGHCE